MYTKKFVSPRIIEDFQRCTRRNDDINLNIRNMFSSMEEPFLEETLHRRQEIMRKRKEKEVMEQINKHKDVLYRLTGGN